eukprot:gene4277-5458_t
MGAVVPVLVAHQLAQARIVQVGERALAVNDNNSFMHESTPSNAAVAPCEQDGRYRARLVPGAAAWSSAAKAAKVQIRRVVMRQSLSRAGGFGLNDPRLILRALDVKVWAS